MIPTARPPRIPTRVTRLRNRTSGLHVHRETRRRGRSGGTRYRAQAGLQTPHQTGRQCTQTAKQDVAIPSSPPSNSLMVSMSSFRAFMNVSSSRLSRPVLSLVMPALSSSPACLRISPLSASFAFVACATVPFASKASRSLKSSTNCWVAAAPRPGLARFPPRSPRPAPVPGPLPPAHSAGPRYWWVPCRLSRPPRASRPPPIATRCRLRLCGSSCRRCL